MSIRPISALVLALACLVGSATATAEALLKTVPMPELSRLPAAQANELRDLRVTFETKRKELIGPALAEAYALLGAAYASSGLDAVADVALENASLLAPEDGRWVYARGVLARKQQQAAVAQNFFQLALQLDDEYLPIRAAVARSKIDNGDPEGARKLIEPYAAKHPDQAYPHAMLGDIALRQKRNAEAVSRFQRALAIEPGATRLYARLAEAQAAAGDAAAAAQSRAKAGAVEPMLPDPIAQGLGAAVGARGGAAAATTPGTDGATRLAQEAGLLLLAGQYGAARGKLDEALKQRPDEPALLAMYARIEAADGNIAAAKTRAAAAVAAGRDSSVAHLSQGVALEMGNDDAGARRAYEEAVVLDPKAADARSLLGDLLLRTGHPDDAATHYRVVVQQDLTRPEPWMRLVAAYVEGGRCAMALRDVSDVLAADAGNTFVLQLFVRLASTCRAASAAERKGALEYGSKLHADAANAQSGEALALALAANGKWDDAVKTQQAAMFVLVRNGLKGALTPYRQVLTQLQAKQLPDRPWPASAAVYHPQRLAPAPKPAPARAR
jgi:tetratricopeptide (TPR) repeat protein